MKREYSPTNDTIRKVVKYLDEHLGLEVHGRCIDLDAGIMYDSLMEYSAEDIIKLRKLVQKDDLVDHSEIRL